MLTGGRYRAARAAKNRISCFYSAASNSFEEILKRHKNAVQCAPADLHEGCEDAGIVCPS